MTLSSKKSIRYPFDVSIEGLRLGILSVDSHCQSASITSCIRYRYLQCTSVPPYLRRSRLEETPALLETNDSGKFGVSRLALLPIKQGRIRVSTMVDATTPDARQRLSAAETTAAKGGGSGGGGGSSSGHARPGPAGGSRAPPAGSKKSTKDMTKGEGGSYSIMDVERE